MKGIARCINPLPIVARTFGRVLVIFDFAIRKDHRKKLRFDKTRDSTINLFST